MLCYAMPCHMPWPHLDGVCIHQAALALNVVHTGILQQVVVYAVEAGDLLGLVGNQGCSQPTTHSTHSSWGTSVDAASQSTVYQLRTCQAAATDRGVHSTQQAQHGCGHREGAAAVSFPSPRAQRWLRPTAVNQLRSAWCTHTSNRVEGAAPSSQSRRHR